MKKFSLIILSIFGISLFFSCEGQKKKQTGDSEVTVLEEIEEADQKKKKPKKRGKKESKKPESTQEVEKETDEEEEEVEEEPELSSFSLAWGAGDNQVYEYEIHVGSTEDNLALYKKFRDGDDEFSLAAPEVELSLEDLGLEDGEKFCFQIFAVSIQGTSPGSEVSCFSHSEDDEVEEAE